MAELTIVAGIQPVGTIVYADPRLNYSEVVIASNLGQGKQLIRCMDTQNPLYRIEWIDEQGYDRNRGIIRANQAYLFYNSLMAAPEAHPEAVAEYLIDTDPYGDYSINAHLIRYRRESGNRLTPAIREKAVSLYHSWQAEQENDPFSLYYPR